MIQEPLKLKQRLVVCSDTVPCGEYGKTWFAESHLKTSQPEVN